jgi:hypothetical protein
MSSLPAGLPACHSRSSLLRRAVGWHFELKYLFRASQPWSRGHVNTFLDAAWNYIGFK